MTKMPAEIVNHREVQSAADRAVRGVIVQVLNRCHKSRLEVAAAMSAELGHPVTIHQLNQFAATSKPGARFPAAWIHAFCMATGDDSLQRLAAGERLQKLIGLAEGELAAAADERARRALREQLLQDVSPRAAEVARVDQERR